MGLFRITYKTGLVEEYEQSDCNSVEAFINAKFGSVEVDAEITHLDAVATATSEEAGEKSEAKVQKKTKA